MVLGRLGGARARKEEGDACPADDERDGQGADQELSRVKSDPVEEKDWSWPMTHGLLINASSRLHLSWLHWKEVPKLDY